MVREPCQQETGYLRPVHRFPWLGALRTSKIFYSSIGYNYGHALLDAIDNPMQRSHDDDGPPRDVPHYDLSHRAPGICAIGAARGGPGRLADGNPCADEAD